MNSITRYVSTVVTCMLFVCNLYAGKPLWTFEAITPTNLTVMPGETANVQYRITNQSRRMHRLTVESVPGVNQVLAVGFAAPRLT